VKIINLREGDVIASVMAVPVSDEEELVESVVAEGTEDAAETAQEPAVAQDEAATQE
jgi:DNA gyrase subunit A